MSAVKSLRVIGYDSSIYQVTFEDNSTKHFSDCVKNEKIALCNFLGIRFKGKPAQYHSLVAINDAILRWQAIHCLFGSCTFGAVSATSNSATYGFGWFVGWCNSTCGA
jgi:hypothetical protein